MKANVSRKRNLLNINFHTIHYKKALQLLELLKVDKISIFIEQGDKYCFKNIISIKQFMKYIKPLKESMLIFDGDVRECLIDRELNVVSDKKILIDFNYGENETTILVNLKHIDILEENIREIMQ